MKKLLLTISVLVFAILANAQSTTRLVLLEHFSNASCGPCAAANPAMQARVDDPANAGKIVSIKYQWYFPGFDPMHNHNPTEANNRTSYYGINGVPNSVLDGNYFNDHPNLWNQGTLDTRAAVNSPFSLNAAANWNFDSSIVSVDMQITASDANTGTYVAHIVVVEKEINFTSAPGTNGETDFYSVMKKMLPDENGTSIASTWAAGDTASVQESWTVANAYDKDELAVVVFIQNTTTQEVLQAFTVDVLAEGPPVVNFTADNIYIAPGTTVNFTDRTAFAPTGWNWNFDVGGIGGVTPSSTSTAQNPSAVFNNYGDYDIQLIATNVHGADTLLDTASIHVIDCQDVQLDLQLDDIGSTVSWEIIKESTNEVLRSGNGYPNTTGGQLVTSSLCLGDGCYKFVINDAGGNGICCTSGTNGSYTITNNSTSSVLGTGGQFTFRDTLDFCVSTGTAAPVAAFTGSQTTICEHNDIQFLDQSTNTATSWQWTFPGGNPSSSTLRNPLVDYPTAGSYAVTLVATNANGNNTVTTSSYVTVNSGPLSTAGADVTLCANNVSPINLSGSVTVATGGAWSSNGSGSFGNSSSLTTTYTPSATDISNGSAVITLSSTGNGTCIANTDNLTITFTPAPVVNAGADMTVCESETTFSLNGSVTSATGGIWTGGNGTFANDTVLNADYTLVIPDIVAGGITLTLTSTGNGICGAESDDIVISFQEAPESVAGDDDTICGGNNIILDGSFTGSSGVKWFTSGTGTFTPIAAIKNPIYIPSADDISAGNVMLELRTTGNGDCPAAKDTLNLVIHNCTGIEDNILNSKVSVYPNPTSGVIYLDSKDIQITSVNLVNVLGENLKSFNINNSSDLISLSVSDIAYGSYILNVVTNEGTLHKSITIQK